MTWFFLLTKNNNKSKKKKAIKAQWASIPRICLGSAAHDGEILSCLSHSLIDIVSSKTCISSNADEACSTRIEGERGSGIHVLKEGTGRRFDGASIKLKLNNHLKGIEVSTFTKVEKELIGKLNAWNYWLGFGSELIYTTPFVKSIYYIYKKIYKAKCQVLGIASCEI